MRTRRALRLLSKPSHPSLLLLRKKKCEGDVKMNIPDFELFVGIITILCVANIIELLIIFWLLGDKFKKETDEEIEKMIKEA
jgi:hypothetical protein